MDEQDIFSRVRAIYDPALLAGKLVTVIGLGSIGSAAAILLAKSGVGRFRLIDPDILKRHNILRHASGVRGIGRSKVHVMADLIHEWNPDAEVEVRQIEIPAAEVSTEALLAGSDIVVVAIDTVKPRGIINLAALVQNIPAVYAGAYTRACAGEVYRVIPGKSACFDCIQYLFRRHELGEPTRYEQTTYGGNEAHEPSEIPAEAGLGIHVSYLATLQADIAFRTLLRPDHSLPDFEYNFYIVGIYPEKSMASVYGESIEIKPFIIPPQKECLTCAMTGFVSVEEAAKQASGE